MRKLKIGWLEVQDLASLFLLKEVTYHDKNWQRSFVDATVCHAKIMFENKGKTRDMSDCEYRLFWITLHQVNGLFLVAMAAFSISF